MLSTGAAAGMSFEVKGSAEGETSSEVHGSGRGGPGKKGVSHARAESDGRKRRFNFEAAEVPQTVERPNKGQALHSPPDAGSTPGVDSKRDDKGEVSAVKIERPKHQDFRCFAVHKDPVTALCFNPHGRQLITGSLTGEVCIVNDNGSVERRRNDFKGEVLHMRLVDRHPSLFESTTAIGKVEDRAHRYQLFSAFSKRAEDNAFQKHEMVILLPRHKKIKKEKVRKHNLAEFLTAFAPREDSDGTERKQAGTGGTVGQAEEIERLRREMEELKKVNARLLNVCAELDKMGPQ